MNFDPNDELIVEFRQEAMESLEDSEMALLDIDKGGDFPSHYNSIFRGFHSLKGGAGMLGMSKLETLVHHLETLLSKSKEEKALASPQVDYFLQGIDAAKELLNGGSPEFSLIDPMLSRDEKKEEAKEGTNSENNEASCPYRIMFLVDGPDNKAKLEMIASYGFEVKSFSIETDYQGEIGKFEPHAVIAYLKQVGDVEMEVVDKVHKADTELPVIFCGDGITKDTFTEGMTRGAYALMEKVGGESSFMSTVTNAIRKYQAMKVLNECIDMIFYRFSDVDDNLMAKKDEESRRLMKEELEHLLEKRKELKELSITLH